MLRSSSHPRPAGGPTEAHRIGDCTKQLQGPRLADTAMPMLASVFPLFRKRLAWPQQPKVVPRAKMAVVPSVFIRMRGQHFAADFRTPQPE